MSPKSSSLAIDEITQEDDYLVENEICEPILTVLVNKRTIESSSFDNLVSVKGRINVSF